MTSIGKPFKSLESYNKAMTNSLDDKLFFVDKLPKDDYLFVDFGCADGALLERLQQLTHASYIGYDISDEMLSLARVRTPNIEYTNNWLNIEKATLIAKEDKKKVVLILSSVLHEVFSYSSKKLIQTFWHNIKIGNFDYIVVRDMMPSDDIWRPTSKDLYEKVCLNADKNQLQEFEIRWGTIKNNRNFVHFLLKYRYKTNWFRELNENYFPIYLKEFLKTMNSFNTDYLERFRVPFLEKCWKEEFDIKIKDYTHIKAIFSRRLD